MRRVAAIACFCLTLWATPAWAANDVTLTAMSGMINGSINVSGTVTADSGWSPGSKISISLWQDGCLLTTNPNISLTSSGCNTWTFNADFMPAGMTSGVTFNVVGDLTFTNLCACPQPFRTQPVTAQTK